MLSCMVRVNNHRAQAIEKGRHMVKMLQKIMRTVLFPQRSSHKPSRLMYLAIVVLIQACCTIDSELCWNCIPPGKHRSKYVFDIPIKLWPARDTFRVGDTIWVESVFSKRMVEATTGREFTIENVEWVPDILIFPLTREIIALYKKDIELFPPWEELGSYGFDGAMYSLKYHMVLKDTGLYIHCLQLDETSHDYSELEFEGKCPSYGVEVQMRVNEGDNNNIHMLQQSPHYFFINYYSKPEVFYTNGCYCFRVVE